MVPRHTQVAVKRARIWPQLAILSLWARRRSYLSPDCVAPATISPRPPGFVCPQTGPALVTDAYKSAHLLAPAPTRLAPPPPTMANGGGRRGLCGEWRRTAVAAETHSPPHVQRARLARREGDPSEERPIGRATHRKSDPWGRATHRKVDPSEDWRACHRTPCPALGWCMYSTGQSWTAICDKYGT